MPSKTDLLVFAVIFLGGLAAYLMDGPKEPRLLLVGGEMLVLIFYSAWRVNQYLKDNNE